MASFGLLACLWAGRYAALAGLGRLASQYALESGRLGAADAAVRLSPADAEAHAARAALLVGSGMASEAAAGYERAALLRPRDYALRLGLGGALDQAGDGDGALAAFAAAVREAPSYAEPRWQLGNALVRAGRRAEAMAELRRAASADASLFPNFIEIAWQSSGGDAPSFLALVAPTGDSERLLVSHFLIRHGAAADAVRLARATGSLAESDRRALLTEAIAAGAFAEAHELWSSQPTGADASDAIHDGGFERDGGFDDPGFGWRVARGGDASFAVSLDLSAPREGARSLRLDFRGGAPPPAEIVAQLVLVEAGVRYRLSFAARARDLVTGGPPLVRVVDAQTGTALAESPPLPEGTTDGWRDLTVEFAVPPGARAVRVVLLRRPCAQAVCPVFGQLWLDDFRLLRLSGGGSSREGGPAERPLSPYPHE